jgi:hypothetical protein
MDHFGGVVETRYRIEGAWKLGPATLQGEVVVYRVLAPQAAEAVVFFTQLKEELRADAQTANAVPAGRRSLSSSPSIRVPPED